MKTAPVIIVQLIHIEGPMKGRIQELSDSEIKIGRHSSCQLCFPADYTTISRVHATISREGNRFKLTNHSANGTIVNGKPVTETFLKDGDVITVSKGGPKISFLTQVSENALVQEIFEPQIPEPPTATPPLENIAPQPVAPTPQPPIPEPPPVKVEPPAAPHPSKTPLIIQYGPTLRSFDNLPLKIGKQPGSDFHLDLPDILGLHAEIYFAEGQYWIRDLTGQQVVTVNSVPADQGMPLQINDELALSAKGPFFQFLGNGRLGEVEKMPETAPQAVQEKEEHTADTFSAKKELKKSLSFFKKILSK